MLRKNKLLTQSEKGIHIRENISPPDRDLSQLLAGYRLRGETFTSYELNIFVDENQDYSGISLKLCSHLGGIVFVI